MKNFSLFFLVAGLALMSFAIFSRFYGEPSVALRQFRSSNFLLLANTILIISLILAHHNRYRL